MVLNELHEKSYQANSISHPGTRVMEKVGILLRNWSKGIWKVCPWLYLCMSTRDPCSVYSLLGGPDKGALTWLSLDLISFMMLARDALLRNSSLVVGVTRKQVFFKKNE